jgi:hypothetical protein
LVTGRLSPTVLSFSPGLHHGGIRSTTQQTDPSRRRQRWTSAAILPSVTERPGERASCAASPSHIIDLDDDDQLAAVARRFLVPMLDAG